MKLFNFVFLILLCFLNLHGKDIYPSFKYEASGFVSDIIFKDNKLYISNDASSIDIFELNKKTANKTIKIEKIKDFMGDIIDAKIYSIDILDKSLLILSQGEKGGRNINIYKDGKFKELISSKKRLFIAKAKFIDKNTIIFALLSNEVYLFNIKEQRTLTIKQISHSKFSNFVLSEDKSKIIIADESGDLKMLNTKNLELIKTFEKQNLDNVFQVDIKKDIILSAGQDRKAAVYELNSNKSYHKKADFLIYSAALSPSGKLAAIAVNENNDILIFNTKNKKDLYLLKNNPAIITNILFINENEIFVTSDDTKINYFKID